MSPTSPISSGDVARTVRLSTLPSAAILLVDHNVWSGQLLRWPTAAYLVSLPYVMSAIADICPLYVVCHRQRTWNGGKLGGGSQTSVVAEMDNTTMHSLPAELAGAEVIVVGD